jgi:hypothetical protein
MANKHLQRLLTLAKIALPIAATIGTYKAVDHVMKNHVVGRQTSGQPKK